MMKGLCFLRVSSALYNGLQVRSMASSVDKALLSKLRKRTGISFINCKKALQQFENDLEKAEKWLKEQAQKEGWAKATKLQSRSMSNGLVAVVSNKEAATMIEMNCETDFVARNNKFINLASSLVKDCQQALLEKADAAISLDAVVGSLGTGSGQSLADRVALEVGNIGENMLLRRAVHLKAGTGHLATYVHASGPDLSGDSECRLGKYGVVLSLSQTGGEGEISLEELSHKLAQHIVGMNPCSVGSLQDKAPDAGEGETGKPEGEREGEERRLVHQEFLLDPSVSVGQLLQANGATVNSFFRFACGEELPQDQKD